MYLGTAWYPEHWDEDRWAVDLGLMRDLGFNVVRVGEFAWRRLETEEGSFDIGWLERAINLAAEFGLESVACTPTAAPPAWLTQRYPETLGVREDGWREVHGGRCHYSPASPVYQRFSARIAEEMAKSLGSNRNVIGWQIDNEFLRFSYDPETQSQFQSWLKDRYGSLDRLNQHWTTAFWSEEYTNWEQIPIHSPNGYSHNPGLALDLKRFITHTYRTFLKQQTDAIRKHADPQQWITHNFMCYFDLFDHYELSEELDIASWDSYVGRGHLDYRFNGSSHDLTRGFKRRNFWVAETQCGWTGSSPGVPENSLDRGEIRTLTWHHVGHGADGVLYFQWRSALSGQEQCVGSIVAPDGKLRRQHVEFAEIGRDFARTADILRDTSPVSQTAILFSYEDLWTIGNISFDPDIRLPQHLIDYYSPIRDITHEVDILHPLSDLKSYRLAIAPSLHVLNEARAANLRQYVLSGGHLVVGPRSGAKDDYNAFLTARQPGPLAELLGAHVDEYYRLDEPVSVSGEWGAGESSYWAELLEVDSPDTQVLLRWGKSNGWLDGEPAMVTRKVGEGRITYLGARLDSELMKVAAQWMVETSGVEPPFGRVPAGIEVCRRTGENREVFIIINHSKMDQRITLPRSMKDVITDCRYDTAMELRALQAAVLI